jgi:hypothetical protein
VAALRRERVVWGASSGAKAQGISRLLMYGLKPVPFKLKPVPLLRRARAAYTPPFTLIVGESCAS